MAAHFIGWPDSPFQWEVGFVILGFAVFGLLAFRGCSDMRMSAVAGPACLLLGAAGGHLLEAVTTRSYSRGNVGVVLYTEFLLPVIGFALLRLQHHYSHLRAVRSTASGFVQFRSAQR